MKTTNMEALLEAIDIIAGLDVDEGVAASVLQILQDGMHRPVARALAVTGNRAHQHLLFEMLECIRARQSWVSYQAEKTRRAEVRAREAQRVREEESRRRAESEERLRREAEARRRFEAGELVWGRHLAERLGWAWSRLRSLPIAPVHIEWRSSRSAGEWAVYYYAPEQIPLLRAADKERIRGQREIHQQRTTSDAAIALRISEARFRRIAHALRMRPVRVENFIVGHGATRRDVTRYYWSPTQLERVRRDFARMTGLKEMTAARRKARYESAWDRLDQMGEDDPSDTRRQA